MGAPKGNKFAVGNTGRPESYNFDLCVAICQRVAMGEHIKAVLDSDSRYPSFPTWCSWKRDHDELFNLYTKSIQDKAEMVTFEIGQTMEDLRNKVIDPASARVIIDTLKWFASKFYPKMFGDKLDLTSDNKAIQSSPVSVLFDGQLLQASNVTVKDPNSDES